LLKSVSLLPLVEGLGDEGLENLFKIPLLGKVSFKGAVQILTPNPLPKALTYLAQHIANACLKAPKARNVTAWGNAPGTKR
jgi:hypothetical protein